ncbi:hypothetical protein [Singulisphaera sp. PoT]|uniref:hypothetical protein n=1 Tax=Singulisphaera sp. PoT TaxID=3411797 RepID=UPI003BF60584
MVVPIYADPAGGLHLVPPPHHRLVAYVQAPEGSRISEARGIGWHLAVPAASDGSQHRAWAASLVLSAAHELSQGFRLV